MNLPEELFEHDPNANMREPIPMPDQVAETLKERGMLLVAQAGAEEDDDHGPGHEDHEHGTWQTDLYANPIDDQWGILIVSRIKDEVVPMPLTPDEVAGITHITGMWAENQRRFQDMVMKAMGKVAEAQSQQDES